MRNLINVFEGESLYENGILLNVIKVQLELGRISICAFCSLNSTCSSYYSCGAGAGSKFSYILFDSVKYIK